MHSMSTELSGFLILVSPHLNLGSIRIFLKDVHRWVLGQPSMMHAHDLRMKRICSFLKCERFGLQPRCCTNA